MDDKKVLVSGYLMFILGFVHLILAILGMGLLELTITACIFTGFYIPMGYGLIHLVKNNLLDETRALLLGTTTISFLNSLTYFLLIITGAPEDRLYLYYILIIVIVINILNFPILFKKKIELNKMTFDEKLSYFAIVVVRGLGFSFSFNILAFIGWPMDPVYPMIIYLLVFGILNLKLSGVLYNKSQEKKIQKIAIIMLLVGMTIGIGLFFLYPNPKTVVWTILYLIVIPIRFYYFNKSFR